MANVLSDNTVVPSFMSVRQRGRPENTGQLTNTALRIGEVKEIVLPDSAKSVSKRWLEYVVEVQHRDGGSPASSALYYGCVVANLFGGVADRFEYTLRPDDPQVPAQRGEDGVGIGSKVTLLCPNGETTRALIIGGVKDRLNDDETVDPNEGHHLLWEFNGVRAEIDKEGAFTLTFRGPTRADGLLSEDADPAKSGAQFKLKADGGVEFTHDGQTVIIDHKKSDIVIKADHEVNVTGKKNVNVNTDGTATITSKQTKIGSPEAKEALVLGSTWRRDETDKNKTLISQFTTMATLMGALAASIMTASISFQAASIAHLVPISGPIAGAVPMGVAAQALGSASSQLANMGSALSQIVTAISQYEGKAASQLSTKNVCD
jgi:hypothetical protein